MPAQPTRLAIPTDAPRGLDAPPSDHFGHADTFTLIDLRDGRPVQVSVLDNPGHTGWADLVQTLAQVGVNAVIVRGIGQRPLHAFTQLGIVVHGAREENLRALVERFLAGGMVPIGLDQVCQGGDGHGGDHSHTH